VPGVARSLAIIPAYNEAQSIQGVISDLARKVPDFDVLVVDDGSTDITSRLARDAGARVATLPFNLGIGGAVQTGYKYAADHGYDRAIQVDGDGQHDAGQIALLSAYLDEHPDVDMVIGSRFLAQGSGYRSSASRRVGIRIFGWLLSRIVRQRVSDPTSGFRMVARRGIELFARDYPHDYPEVEAILMIHAHRLRSAEVPVSMRERQGGTSSITPGRSIYYMVKVMLAVLIGLLRARPVVVPGDDAAVRSASRI
jgi:glycosyltransferase involved in cell wall biosynthesis